MQLVGRKRTGNPTTRRRFTASGAAQHQRIRLHHLARKQTVAKYGWSVPDCAKTRVVWKREDV
ncbi:hypothetical protein [Streptomyces sp. NPDC001492]